MSAQADDQDIEQEFRARRAALFGQLFMSLDSGENEAGAHKRYLKGLSILERAKALALGTATPKETSAMKTIVHPTSGRNFALGRNIPSVWRPTLDAARYLSPAVMPARPLGQRWESKAIHALHDPLGNDQFGCCVFAAAFKQDVAWLRDAGDASSPNPTKDDCLELYSRVTGFDPKKPATDRGGDLQTALAYFKAHGMYADGRGKVASWVAVDPSKPAMIRAALDAFGSLYTGCQLAPEWARDPEEGFVWDVTPSAGGDDMGHCTAWFDYDAVGVIVNSWGLFGRTTWAAIEKYWAKSAGGEIYAVFSPDWLSKATQVSPSGLNAAQLAADVAAEF